ncbi:MAG: hypothetical protein EOO27_45505, partial [Comamonadaceae bacterium]
MAEPIQRHPERGTFGGMNSLPFRSAIGARSVSGSLGSCGDRNTTDQRVLHMAKYSHRMVPEIFQTFWAGMTAG